ncbi:glycosyltransferase 25 family member-like [Ischnura elegans]|uniref:glycosyltransferase 25 family member-like n=1 Tax=Ischnura elegans TaxID=197161 RepID=UPI001ED87FA7|nr:glycosyltransferase 25 family member-like [Ischnura elegans]
MGIKAMPEYADPYHKRPLTMGEIGCFLSHYTIWYNVLERGQEVVMVLEDDIRFEPYFRQKVMGLLEETRRLSIDWDLIYLGRKRLAEADGEEWVEGSKHLVWAGYSYWTLGYLLASSGARKLVEGQPLARLLPVDEYLPIMSDRHPEELWKAHFSPRDLRVMSAAPLLLFPTHYTGEQGYVSDTEDSITVPSVSPHQRDDL